MSEDGTPHRLPLAEVCAVPFEHGLPVRRFASRKGQRHLSGLWWSAAVVISVMAPADPPVTAIINATTATPRPGDPRKIFMRRMPGLPCVADREPVVVTSSSL